MRYQLSLAGALIAILLMSAPVQAEAASADRRSSTDEVASAAPSSQIGRLTLSNRGATVVTTTYIGCPAPGRVLLVDGNVDRFDNLPADGCEVVLTNKLGGSFELCIGRGSVPPALRQAPTVRIRPGASVVCP